MIPESVQTQREKQIKAILKKFGDLPDPSRFGWQQLRIVWDAGFETAEAELSGMKVNVNTQRARQSVDMMIRLGLTSPREAELIVHTWTTGLLTCRDMRGVGTAQHPSDSRLDRIRVREDA